MKNLVVSASWLTIRTAPQGKIRRLSAVGGQKVPPQCCAESFH
jgi:hypothetical protein